MVTKLKGLKITSTDLVDAGANPDAHIRLFKRNDTPGETPDTFIQKIAAAISKMVFGEAQNTSNVVAKKAATFSEELNREQLHHLTSEVFDFVYALSDSFCSIICDDELDTDGKRDMLFNSLDEFTEAARDNIPHWADRKHKKDGGEPVVKSAEQTAAFEKLWSDLNKAAEDKDPDTDTGTDDSNGKPIESDTDDDDDNVDTSTAPQGEQNNSQKEEKEMKFDKSQMTAEEQATLADFEKRYGITDLTATEAAEIGKGVLHPEVQKALTEMQEVNKARAAEVEELRKSLELERLTTFAKKYEIIGKKADELAEKLYGFKKAGGTVYDDYVALLDESVTNVEKSGLFSEIGKNQSGGGGASDKISIAASEIRKNNPALSQSEAIAKAFEEHPDLANEYENGYKGGNK